MKMLRDQEPKYDAIDGKIVNRASGDAIPDDEPVFIFRARDIHAREALEAYACVLTPGVHRNVVCQRIADFAKFAETNPGRMKEPDTDPSVLTPKVPTDARRKASRSSTELGGKKHRA
jgi:hypothetical protein